MIKFAIIAIVLFSQGEPAPVLPPCRDSLPALSRTLPYVPMASHDRKAAHSLLRLAYRAPDDSRCRKIAGHIVDRFIMNNWELKYGDRP